MERLTKRVGDVVVYVGTRNEEETGQIPCEVSPQGVREILERLAKYEDTELWPESVEALKLSMMGKTVFLTREEAEETEYIPRETVFEQFDNGEADVIEIYPDGSGDFGFGASNIRNLINAIPAADVAPVVRCRDCAHSYDGIGGRVCTYGPCVDCVVEDDFYCKNGKRGDENDGQ